MTSPLLVHPVQPVRRARRVGGAAPARLVLSLVAVLGLVLTGLVASALGPVATVPGGVAAPPLAATRSWVAPSMRTIPAYRENHRLTIMKFDLMMPPGQRRMATARVVATTPRSTPDEVLWAAVGLTCYVGGRSFPISATENVFRGRSKTFDMRVVMTAPWRDAGLDNPWSASCHVYASGGRPRKSGSARRSANVWKVGGNTRMSLSTPLPAWSQQLSDPLNARSRLLQPGDSVTIARQVVRLDDEAVRDGVLDVLTDNKLTVCSSPNGSRDRTTGGRNLCVGHVTPGGSSYVGVSIRAQQLSAVGLLPCGAEQVLSRVDRAHRISGLEHHVMVAVDGKLAVREACAPVFVVTVKVKLLRGTDTVLHGPNVSTLLTP